MRFRILLTILSVTLLLLTGCINPLSKSSGMLSFENSYSSNFKTAATVRGYKNSTLNLVKYNNKQSNLSHYKLQVMSQAGDSPSFKKGESLTLVLNQKDKMYFTSLDGEVTVRYHKTRPIRAIYYPITEKELRRIAFSKDVEFYSYGYNYDVAGKLSPDEIKVFRKMYERG